MAEDVSIHPEIQRRQWDCWFWRDGDDRSGQHFRTCSFCGSIHPADLAAEAVWEAVWADRKYGWPHKFYADLPNRDPDRLFTLAATSGERRPHSGWTAVADLSDEQLAAISRDRWPMESTTWLLFGRRPVLHAKFYVAHLADPAVAGVRADIERRCGLSFDFAVGADGVRQVSWSESAPMSGA